MALWNNVDTQKGKPKFIDVGQLEVVNITNAGSGYTNATVAASIDAPPAGGVQAVATVTIAGGKVTAVTITNPGAGYTAVPAVTFSSGAGSNSALTAKIRGVLYTNSSIVFVDQTEAQNASNRAKGLKTPGWNQFTTYTDNSGATRYKVNPLVAMRRTAANAGDAADDTIIGDVAYSIGTQPASWSSVGGVPTTVSVVAATPSAYQWQMRPAAGGQYTNLTNAGVYSNVTTATLGISSSLGLTGNQYRCVVLNGAGTASATSNGAVLTSVFSIITQPAVVTAIAPHATSFTVSIAGASTYQWQVKIGAAAYVNIANAGVYTTATTATLNISDPTGLTGNLYRVVCGNGTTTVTSTGVALTVTPALAIDVQPAARSVTAPANTDFQVEATGVATYVWYVKIGAAAYVPVVASGIYSGVTDSLLIITDSTGLDGNLYQCVISNGVDTLTTTPALLTVAP